MKHDVLMLLKHLGHQFIWKQESIDTDVLWWNIFLLEIGALRMGDPQAALANLACWCSAILSTPHPQNLCSVSRPQGW